MITPAQIEKLRENVSSVLSEKRMKHVLAVEDMAFRIGLLFYRNDSETLNLLRAAALLHDVTKELTDEEQLAILSEHSVRPLPEDLASMPTIHALTGALIIPERIPEYSLPCVPNPMTPMLQFVIHFTSDLLSFIILDFFKSIRYLTSFFLDFDSLSLYLVKVIKLYHLIFLK